MPAPSQCVGQAWRRLGWNNAGTAPLNRLAGSSSGSEACLHTCAADGVLGCRALAARWRDTCGQAWSRRPSAPTHGARSGLTVLHRRATATAEGHGPLLQAAPHTSGMRGRTHLPRPCWSHRRASCWPPRPQVRPWWYLLNGGPEMRDHQGATTAFTLQTRLAHLRATAWGCPAQRALTTTTVSSPTTWLLLAGRSGAAERDRRVSQQQSLTRAGK